MKSQVRVVGNLALAPMEERRFYVIDGSAPRKVVAPARPELFDVVACPKHSARGMLGSAEGLVFALVSVLVVACLAGAVLFGSGSSAQVQAALQDAPSEVVDVKPGDTLWQIAADHPIEGLSTADAVAAIKLANDLDTGMLVPGMELYIPVSGI